jgi:hypothetical protein
MIRPTTSIDPSNDSKHELFTSVTASGDIGLLPGRESKLYEVSDDDEINEKEEKEIKALLMKDHPIGEITAIDGVPTTV